MKDTAIVVPMFDLVRVNSLILYVIAALQW